MFTATIHFNQQRECILRELTADVDHAVPIEVEEVRNGTVTFVLRAGEHADAFQAALEATDHVEYVDRLDDANLLVTKPSCGAYSAIYQNHGTLRRSNTVRGRHREYNVLVFRREDLKAIIDDLEQFGTVTLGKLETFTETTESPLTVRQRDVVIEALARGYYDWPRGINNEDLAAELEISRATLHEHLRRAEKKLLTMGLTDELVRPALGTPESTVADPTDSGHG
jgi:predicted DNA binding protein